MISKILIVDDDEEILTQMRVALEADFTVLTSSTASDALASFLNEKPSVVILDLALNFGDPADLEGLRLLERFVTLEPSTRVIVVTGNTEDSIALRAVRLGACDYYSKPIRLAELKVIIQRALHIHRLYQRLQASYPDSKDGFHGLIGSSNRMKETFRFIERVGPSDISVLICGESGTGKELVAHGIHKCSERRGNPFVAVNCSAIPETLLESELFGHEKGAFTGAYVQKRGKFETANTGTLFLDEIGDLAPALQVKLLRFLQDRKIERVGGNHPIELDLRIIAATNRDLKKSMENSFFREDLYYRLKVVPWTIPPLRERKEDIVPLAQYFLKKYCKEHHKTIIRLSSDAEKALMTHPWPGNVRELENSINRAVVLSSNAVLSAHDLGINAVEESPQNLNLKLAKQTMELNFVTKALSRNKGIVSRAAKELGISRVNLYELIEKYDIHIQEFKTNPRQALNK